MTDIMEKIVSLAKRRGFIFPGSEIYSGIGGIYDLGPFGVELAKNIKNAWWKNIVSQRENVVGLDSAILMNRQIWHTSGHVESFADPLVECKNCHSRFREDTLPKSKNCPTCGKNDWTESRMFNLMFKTHIGPVEEEGSETFLRPETAQGIFVNFGNVVDTMRVKLPFGIAQIGKGFRNEITTGNFLFRVREFEMMELEYFTYPKQAEADFEYWQKERMDWHLSLGLKKENLRFREHESDERAHYATRSVDIEYNWPFMNWGELEGIANRTDYDLKQHSKESGKDLSYFDEEKKEKIIPYVIEPSIGVGRMMLALIVDAYSEEKDRIVLKLKPELAPYKVAVFPLLSNKPELVKLAQKIYLELKTSDLGLINWDDRGNIGKRYYAQDEIGTPCCITVDFQSLEDATVTIRDRDSMKQERVKIQELSKRLTF
ncbi:MAG: glycine--tRNA ligase [Candidatus Woykebacteria bacterium RBG_19FT_COMBO_43_10]|uniref:Glycine--tRNA ligase n=1 Tax=Candidatus Woykebacteria bacterium RBG_19FT_COMBO_43_10 TaxID=1802598 RepID=A0A1G1WFV3_9BACT|nr:MAG: glycine--tRNA ligase [Candidatus Woykebacteria bacterium RBG_19FT_COMBO_43_10]